MLYRTAPTVIVVSERPKKQSSCCQRFWFGLFLILVFINIGSLLGKACYDQYARTPLQRSGDALNQILVRGEPGGLVGMFLCLLFLFCRSEKAKATTGNCRDWTFLSLLFVASLILEEVLRAYLVLGSYRYDVTGRRS